MLAQAEEQLEQGSTGSKALHRIDAVSDLKSVPCEAIRVRFSEKAQIAGLRADVLNFAIPAEKARLGLGNAAGIFRVLSPDKHVGAREAIDRKSVVSGKSV